MPTRMLQTLLGSNSSGITEGIAFPANWNDACSR
jgi:hypothetical protein